MKVAGRKLAKHLTEQNIRAALPPGFSLVRVNWKKLKIHIADRDGNITVRHIRSVAQ